MEYYDQILTEIHRVLEQIPQQEQDAFIAEILKARRIFLAGAGRSGLTVKCFAMRLMHLGFQVHSVGDVTTPPVEQGDLLVIASGSGETASLVAMAHKSHSLRAKVALITVSPDSSIGKLSDYTITMNAPTKEDAHHGTVSIQPMGTLFEQSMMIFFDGTILSIAKNKGLAFGDMFKRHANLE